MSKINTSGQEARSQAAAALMDIANLVGVTLGPAGRPVLITSRQNDRIVVNHTKDGYHTLKSLEFESPIHNAVHTLCLQASSNSLMASGDGTTSTLVMAAAFAEQILKTKNNNPQEAIRVFKKEVHKAIEAIQSESVATEESIRKVALTSSNGDEEMTSYVLDALAASSAYGTILVEKNPASKERYKVDKEFGYQAGSGYSYYIPMAISVEPKAVTNADVVLENSYIIPYNGDLMRKEQILPIVNKLHQHHREQKWSIVFVAYDVTEEVAENIAYINRKFPTVSIAAVKTTRTAEVNGDFQQLNDIAAFSGATVVDGASVEHWEISDAGKAGKIRITPSKCYLMGKAENNTIKERAEQNAYAASIASCQLDKDIIEARNASLTGGLVKLIVGGGLFGDLPEIADRADDAIQAAQACMKSGALPGGGASYIRAGQLAGVSEPVMLALASIHTAISHNYGIKPLASFEKGETVAIHSDSIEHTKDFVAAGVADSYETFKAVVTHAFELGSLVANLGGYSLEANIQDMSNAKMMRDIISSM